MSISSIALLPIRQAPHCGGTGIEGLVNPMEGIESVGLFDTVGRRVITLVTVETCGNDIVTVGYRLDVEAGLPSANRYVKVLSALTAARGVRRRRWNVRH